MDLMQDSHDFVNPEPGTLIELQDPNFYLVSAQVYELG